MSEKHPNEDELDKKKEEHLDGEESLTEESQIQDNPPHDEDITGIKSFEPKIEESEYSFPNKELSPDDIENIDELLNEVDGEDDSEILIQDVLEDKEVLEENDEDVKIVTVKELTERTIKRNTIEAALLAAQRPISIEEISIKLEMSKAEIQSLIQELAEDYMDRTTAIEIVQIGEGFAMQIKPEYTEKIVKFASGGLIPKAVMRTLTIIAVKQPLLKSLLVKMRGSTAYEHCKFLIDRGYVTTYKKGRSSVLETTDQFADTFGLSRNIETLKQQLIEQLNISSFDESMEENDSESTSTEPSTTEESAEINENPEIIENGESDDLLSDEKEHLDDVTEESKEDPEE